MAEEPYHVFDSFDIDLLVVVAKNTIFSPIFTFFIPIYYKALGASWDSSFVVLGSAYFGITALFWLVRFLSQVWRNNRDLLFKPGFVDWGEQIVLITGGASGIGELLANTLAVRNVTVVVLDLNPIITENYNISFYKCDVSKWEEVEAVAKRVIEEVGHPTVLINNAGVVQGKLILDLSPDDIHQTFDTNVLAHFWTLKAFLPHMIEEKTGHIVSVASVIGLVGAAQLTDYCASKAALVSLHESLRYELDKRYKAPKIRTTLVLPGHIYTPLFSRINLPKSAFYRFTAPSVHPHQLAKAVIAAIDEQESRTIYMPFYTNFARLVGTLPSFARDFFQWLSGADYAMEGFVKVSGRRPEEGPAPAAAPKTKAE